MVRGGSGDGLYFTSLVLFNRSCPLTEAAAMSLSLLIQCNVNNFTVSSAVQFVLVPID